jgi:hypothetical protein
VVEMSMHDDHWYHHVKINVLFLEVIVFKRLLLLRLTIASGGTLTKISKHGALKYRREYRVCLIHEQ